MQLLNYQFGTYDTNKSTGWKLVATLDEKELLDDTNSIFTTTLIMIIVMLLISIALSLILSKGIAQNGASEMNDLSEKLDEISTNSRDI